jgi:hypothetical protein
VLIWMSQARPAGGGKGGDPRSSGVVASLAIAISSRSILDVGRIWADGRQIRNAEGNFATPTTMRVYRGGWLQPPDPAIELAEGVGACPAYRGLSYLVFEDLALAPFGNRVPSFNIEVVADAEGSPCRWLIDMALLAGMDVRIDGDPLPIEGYVARGPEWGAAIAELATALSCSIVPRSNLDGSDGKNAVGAGPFLIEAGDTAHDADLASAWSNNNIVKSARPGRWTVSYLDPDREYSSGSQQFWAGEPGLEGRTSLAIVATATQARAIAREQLQSARTRAERLSIRLPWRWMGLGPGDAFTLSESSTLWRIEEIEIDSLGLRAEAYADEVQPKLQPISTEPGRANLQPALAVPPTRLFAFVAPGPVDTGGTDRVHIIASGMSGWRGAEISLTGPSSPDRLVLGYQRFAVPFGVLAEAVGPGVSGLWALDDALELELADPDFQLEGRDPVTVLQRANMLLIGGELLQFANAVRVGPRRARLSTLLRGLAGTIADAHEAGAQWCFVDPLATISMALLPDWTGGELHIEGSGPGDGQDGPNLQVPVDGTGMGPLAPCHVDARFSVDGALTLSWLPRSPRHFHWIDDETLGGESYRAWLWRGDVPRPGSGGLSKISSATSLSFSALEVASAPGADSADVSVQVEAVGIGPERLRFSRQILIPLAQG